jgi:A/G-specific adenine glycosylase
MLGSMSKELAGEARARARLAEWFEREQRPLPWRATRDPYAIWISEAMLQQTRVETVTPYYQRFLARFPDVGTLAAAPVEDVLALWSGLGYYRRARTLHAAARVIVERHGGRFPRTHAEIAELPGVGPYTAGAVASIAFDEAAPLVDGNVARVFARWFVIDEPQESAAFRRATWDLARRLVERARSAGAWNQALMELGARICTARAPACDACPIARACGALAAGRVEELPQPKRRPATIDVDLLTLVVRDGGRIVVRERQRDERMAGLFELPTIETSGGTHVAARTFGALELRELETLGSVPHTITRHKIRARIASGRVVRGDVAPPYRSASAGELGNLPLTGMTKKILARGFIDRA